MGSSDDAPAGTALQLPLAMAVFETLEARGIAHCHWKSNIRLEQALAGTTDIDLLVSARRGRECEKALLGLGFKRFYAPPFGRYPGVDDWLGCDEGGALVHLQLHYRLVTGSKFVKEQGLPWAELVLADTVRDPVSEVRIPRPEFELLTLYARIASKTSLLVLVMAGPQMAIPSYVRAEAAYLRERCSESVLRRCVGACFPEASEATIRYLVSPDPLSNGWRGFALLRGVRRELVTWRTSSFGLAALRSLAIKLRVRAGMLARRHRSGIQISKIPAVGGRIIAIVGADGAGKSTVVDHLQGWLSWKVEVRSVYLGNARGAHVSAARWLHRRMNPPRTRNQPPEKHGESNGAARSMSVASALRRLWNARARVVQLRRAQRMRERGFVVLTDRYPQNSVVGMLDGPNPADSVSSMTAWIVGHERRCFHRMEKWRPDMVIKLAVDPEVAAGRKPDHDPLQIRSKSEALARLEFPGVRVETVDASMPLQAVIAACRQIVWESI